MRHKTYTPTIIKYKFFEKQTIWDPLSITMGTYIFLFAFVEGLGGHQFKEICGKIARNVSILATIRDRAHRLTDSAFRVFKSTFKKIKSNEL